MSYSELNLLAFQKRFRTERACAKALERMRWPEGYTCPKCGHRHGYRIESRRLIACAACRYQVSLTAGTIFHKTHTPLVKWFWALYLVSQDKGGESALRLSKATGAALQDRLVDAPQDPAGDGRPEPSLPAQRSD